MGQNLQETENCKKCESKKKLNVYILAGAILLGAGLITFAIFYNTKTILTKLDEGSWPSSVAAPSAPTAVQTQPTQPTAPAPTGEVKVAERADAPVLGNKNAKITMIEFSDFQCPFCKKFYDETYSAFKKQFVDTGKVKIVFRHYPLPFHQNAQKAGEAAECANRQGKFWEYHDLLFKNGQGDGTGLAIGDLKKYADSLSLNSGSFGFGKDKFNECLDKGETAEIVKKDMEAGSASGVTGTPTFFVNGAKLVGAMPIASFQQAVNSATKN
jgi:protein-disulfide isomerase